jgi:hypothetical protein
MPLFLAYAPFSVTVKLNATTPFTIWFASASPYFSKQLIGVVWIALIVLIKDLLVMILQLALNMVSIVLLKRHLGKKIQLTATPMLININRVAAAAPVTYRAGNELNTAVFANNNNGVASNEGSVRERSSIFEQISASDRKATVTKIFLLTFYKQETACAFFYFFLEKKI